VADERLVESFVAIVGCGMKEREETKIAEEREREEVTVATLPLVRSRVDRDGGGQAGGDGEGRC
jgi:lipoate-protein ligase B